MISLDDERSIAADAVLIHTTAKKSGQFESGFSFTQFYEDSRAQLVEFIAKLDSK